MGKLLKLVAKMKALDSLKAEEIESLMEADACMQKIAKDDEDSGWRTLEGGTKVHFSEGGGGGTKGKIDKGPSNMKGKTMGEVKAEGKAQTAARRAAKAAAKPAAVKPAKSEFGNYTTFFVGNGKSSKPTKTGVPENWYGRWGGTKPDVSNFDVEEAKIRLNWESRGKSGRSKPYCTISAPGRESVTMPYSKTYSESKIIEKFAKQNGISSDLLVEQHDGPWLLEKGTKTKNAETMKEPASVAYDPQRTGSETPRKLSKAAKQNLDKVASACREASVMCKEKAKQWPAGSEEREIYERYEGIMSKPQAGRPTEAESKALTKKFLGNISSKLKPYAVEKYKKDLANEPKITNDLCDIADDLGTEMFGLEYRLKKASDSSDGGCRVADKIAETMSERRADGTYPTYEEAADNLSDLVRYTQACTTDNLVEHFEKTQKALEAKGYKTVKVKNTWDSYSIKKAYRGVNCVFESPTGTRFELQFHTPESLVGKEVQHPQYEEQRKPETAQKRKDELGNIMYNNMSGLKRPRNIERIKNFP